MSDLIDTTEMYLRTIYELEEEDYSPSSADRRAPASKWPDRVADRCSYGA